MVMTPAIDGPSTAPREGPIFWLAMQPLQQLLIMAQLEHRMRLIVQREDLILGAHFHNLLAHVKAELLGQHGSIYQSGGYSGGNAIAPEP